MRVAASAGEASGEVMLDLFRQELLRREPGSEVLRLQDEVAVEPVFGFSEGLRAGPRLGPALERAENWVARLDPDLVVLVSFSGFHLPLGKRLRRRGYRVLYLGPPQVWAWGGWRVRKLRAAADKVVCLFRFEEALLRKAGVDAVFQGYPLLDSVKGSMSRDQVLDMLGFRHDERYVVFLPGSRPAEIAHHRPLFCRVAGQLGGIRGVMVIRDEEGAKSRVQSPKSEADGIRVVSRNRYDVMRYADCACAVSGTVTAELAILGVPMVVCYHLGWLSRVAAQVLVRTRRFALPNILAGRLVVPETLDPEPEALARFLRVFMRDSDERRKQLDELARVTAGLGAPGAMGRICALAGQMIARRAERRTTNRWIPE